MLDRHRNVPHRRQEDAAEVRHDVRRSVADSVGKHAVETPAGADVTAVEAHVGAVHAVLAEADVAGRTLADRGFDPELVAGIPRQVQHDAARDRPAPHIGWPDAGEGVRAGDDGRLGIVAVEVAADLVQRAGDLRRTPGLVDPERADEIRNALRRVVARGAAVAHAQRRRGVADVLVGRHRTRRAAVRSGNHAPGVRAREGADRQTVGAGIPQRATTRGRVFRDRPRHAVAERRRVRHQVATARRRVGAGAGERVGVRPGLRPGVEVRLRLAEGEARELDERALHIEPAGRLLVGGEVEPAAVVGPQRAVLSLGPNVERNDRAGACPVVVRVEAVVTAGATRDERRAAPARVAEILIVTNPAADLDAGIGARNVEEPFAVQTADLHVFDRFGLDGKIGCLRPRNRDQTRRAAEEKAFHHLHRDLHSLPCGRVPSPPGAPHPGRSPFSPL